MTNEMRHKFKIDKRGHPDVKTHRNARGMPEREKKMKRVPKIQDELHLMPWEMYNFNKMNV